MSPRTQHAPLFGIQVMEMSPNSFLLMTGTRERGRIFVSTPVIRQIIAKYDLEHSQLGYITLQVDPAEKRIHTSEYYPLQYAAGHLFFRRGVATLVELQIEKLMHKRFPGYTIVSGAGSLAGRYAQIKKRRRTPGEALPIQEAIALSRAKVIANHHKQKQKEARSIRGRVLRAMQWMKSKLLLRRRK